MVFIKEHNETNRMLIHKVVEPNHGIGRVVFSKAFILCLNVQMCIHNKHDFVLLLVYVAICVTFSVLPAVSLFYFYFFSN